MCSFPREVNNQMTRVEKIQELKQFFLKVLCEDPQDGTSFDCMVLDALEEAERRAQEMGEN